MIRVISLILLSNIMVIGEIFITMRRSKLMIISTEWTTMGRGGRLGSSCMVQGGRNRGSLMDGA